MMDARTNAAVRLSVVVPCFDEQEVIESSHRRLRAVLGALAAVEFELLYVDDGSRDRTLSLLRAIQGADSRVRVLSLSRNFGHQIAASAGLEAATGDAVVLIDADLQDPPELIPEMLARWREGADVVYGVRAARAGETSFKRLSASAFYRLINRLSTTPIPVDTGDFRLMDRRVVDALLAMPEHDRFLRGMVAWTGFRQEPIRYEREARSAGETKYPLRRMLHFAADGPLSFSLVPLRLAIYPRLSASALALLGMVYSMVLRFFTKARVPGCSPTAGVSNRLPAGEHRRHLRANARGGVRGRFDRECSVAADLRRSVDLLRQRACAAATTVF